MLSNKPYLVNAFYQWIVDSRCSPSLLLDATHSRCKVPLEFVEDGRIRLNVSPEAIRDLDINKNTISFRASFSGVVHIISAPMAAILGVYAEENQEGIFFEPEEEDAGDMTTGSLHLKSVPSIEAELDWQTPEKNIMKSSSSTKKKSASHLSLVE